MCVLRISLLPTFRRQNQAQQKPQSNTVTWLFLSFDQICSSHANTVDIEMIILFISSYRIITRTANVGFDWLPHSSAMECTEIDKENWIHCALWLLSFYQINYFLNCILFASINAFKKESMTSGWGFPCTLFVCRFFVVSFFMWIFPVRTMVVSADITSIVVYSCTLYMASIHGSRTDIDKHEITWHKYASNQGKEGRES